MKAAFTRAYNKEAHLTPYALHAVKKGRRGGPGAGSELGGEDADNEVQESEDEGVNADAMIKVRTRRSRRRIPLLPSHALCSRVACLVPLRSRRSPKPPRTPRKRRRKILARGRAKARLRNDRRPED